jgi:hypothetical protein
MYGGQTSKSNEASQTFKQETEQHLVKLNEDRSELARNLQEAQNKLKVFARIYHVISFIVIKFMNIIKFIKFADFGRGSGDLGSSNGAPV